MDKKEEKSLLVFSQGYIKGYYNYRGEKEVDIYMKDKEAIIRIIPLFDEYMVHATNRKISRKQAVEYMTMPEEERKQKY